MDKFVMTIAADPVTTKEIEAMLSAKIAAGEAETGLYDTGLSHGVVDEVDGKVTFQWFRHVMNLNDLL